MSHTPPETPEFDDSLESRLEEAEAVRTLHDPLNPEDGEVKPIDNEAADLRILVQLREQGVKIGRGMLTHTVFWPAILITAAITLFAVVYPDGTAKVLTTIQGWIVDNLGWYYMLIVAVFIGFALFFGLSKFGKIRLGRDNEKPEFGTLSWFAMLFATGMGVGLVFYGVAEPLTYATADPKPGWTGETVDMAKQGMAQTFVHWGLHPWSIYAIIGLALAYGIHRRGRPVSIRWSLEPLLGDKVKGGLGDVIDIVAVMGTVFGMATSLGLGVQQIAAGVAAMGLVDEVNNTLLVVLIVAITLLATASVASGLGRGIKWLSNINLSLAGVFMVAIAVLGPTVFIFRNMIESLGYYLANFFNMTFDAAAFSGEAGQTWASSWTLFYWGWWISWAPFVGVFIARISRGRTIREFVMGVILVPTTVGFVWFSVMGGTGLMRQITVGDLWGGGDEPLEAESTLFHTLETLPLGSVLSVIAIILVTIFFITSSDSGSLVITMLCAGGHPNPLVWTRILWAFLAGGIAIALLLADGLESLQAGALATALPFSFILLLMCFSMVKTLNLDVKMTERARLMGRAEAITGHVIGTISDDLSVAARDRDRADRPDLWDDQAFEALQQDWLDRLDNRIDYRIQRTGMPLSYRKPPAGKHGATHEADRSSGGAEKTRRPFRDDHKEK